MIKYILKLQNQKYEQLYKFSGEEKANLHTLKMSLNPYSNWITIEEKDDKVYIWINLDEEDYDTWEDIPKLILSMQNYEEIVNAWNLNNKNPKKYLIFTQNDNEVVSLESKDELSQEDLNQLKLDKESQEKWSK